MKIKVDFKGMDEFSRKLRFLRGKLKKMRPLYKSWGIVTHKWILENYKTGGKKLSTGRWKRLRPLTLLSRRGKAERYSTMPLSNTGALKRSWAYKLIAGGVKVGSHMEIAKFHEEGTSPYIIRPKNRRWLWFGVKPAQRTRGQKLGGQLAHVAGKPPSPYRKGRTPGIFAKIVHHPGLPERRQLPSEAEIMPDIMKTTDVWVDKAIKGAR
jgi:hypothetical protein